MILSYPRTFSGAVIPLTSSLPNSRTLNSTNYHSNSPDTFLVAAIYNGFASTAEPPNSSRRAFWDIKFDTAFAVSSGQVEFDSSFVAPANRISFVTLGGVEVKPNFVKSQFYVSLSLFSCDPERADMNCSGSLTPADVTTLILKVFLGSGIYCDNPATKGDLNCDGFRDATDVYLLIRCVFLPAGDSCPALRPTIPDPRDSIIIESKRVLPGSIGSPAFVLRVWITNKDSILNITLPYEEKSLSRGAYINVSYPRNFAGTVTRLTTTLPTNLSAVYGKYNGTSPDSVTLAAFADAGNPFPTREPPNTTRKLLWELKFDSVNFPAGQVQFDTIRILDNTVQFLGPNTERIPVNFVKGVVTVINEKPNWTPIGNKSIAIGQTLAFTVMASDPDSTIPALSVISLPSRADFTDTIGPGVGEFTWTSASYQVGNHFVSFIASDGFLADTEQVTITVLADTVVSRKNGAGFGDLLGSAISGGGDASASVGDVNADGTADYIIGAPGSLSGAGAAFVYSGTNHALLYSISGGAEDDRLGGSVGLLGDVNGDGAADFIIGASEADSGSLSDAGVVYVYSGATGALLYKKYGLAQGDRLGGSVGLSGNLDADGDGRADFAAGAPEANGSVGAVFVYSGATGNLIFQKTGAISGDRLGGSVGLTGDVNGDNRADLIAGAPDAGASAGQVFVYSGATGGLLYQKTGAVGERLGGSVGLTLLNDVDGDGAADFAAGAPGSGTLAGAVYVYSGATGNVIFQKTGLSGDRLGGSVGLTGDVDGDSRADLLVGAPEADPGGLANAGSAFIYSGQTGFLLAGKNGEEAGDRLGGSVGVFNDADGGAVFVVGAPNADPNDNDDAGSAFIFHFVGKGDLNGDGVLTPADVALMLNCVFLQVGYCGLELTDLTCDNQRSPADLVKELNAVYLLASVDCPL